MIHVVSCNINCSFLVILIYCFKKGPAIMGTLHKIEGPILWSVIGRWAALFLSAVFLKGQFVKFILRYIWHFMNKSKILSITTQDTLSCFYPFQSKTNLLHCICEYTLVSIHLIDYLNPVHVPVHVLYDVHLLLLWIYCKSFISLI